MLQEPSEAWSPKVGEIVRVVRIGTLGRVEQIKVGRYGPGFVIHAFTQDGREAAAAIPDRVVCTLGELAPHEIFPAGQP